jgi:hypothetical protein
MDRWWYDSDRGKLKYSGKNANSSGFEDGITGAPLFVESGVSPL